MKKKNFLKLVAAVAVAVLVVTNIVSSSDSNYSNDSDVTLKDVVKTTAIAGPDDLNP